MKTSQSHRRHGESGLVQRVRARLAALPITGRPSIVAGVSGGVDSLALAGVLAALSRKGALAVLAVHVDHRLRPDSGEEQGHVAEQMKVLGIDFLGEHLEPGVRGRHPGVGLEEAARRERFSVLARAAHVRAADAIALAHHETDQAETVLLHLLRGAGLHGMSGMAEWGARLVPWWEPDTPEESATPVAIWRPFLSESKSILEAFVAELGLTPVADPTNASSAFKRNRVRHELLPLLEKISPGSERALARYAQLASAEDAFLDSIARDALSSVRFDGNLLPVDGLAGLDHVVQRRVVRAWLAKALPIGVEVGLERVDAVLNLAIVGKGGGQIQVGSGWQVVRSGGSLRVDEEGA